MKSNKKNTLLYSLFLLLFTCRLSAQEQLGLRLDNFGGINSTALNPASSATFNKAWDLNLIAIGGGGANNLVFVKNTNVINILSNPGKVEPDPNLEEDNPKPREADKIYIDFFDVRKPKYVTGAAHIMGPSLLLNLPQGHSVGIVTAMRVGVGSPDLPLVANLYEYRRPAFDSVFKVQAFRGSGMVWGEVGLNYTYRMELNTGYFAIGGTAKYLMGLQAGYIYNSQEVDAVKYTRDSGSVALKHLEIGVTTNAAYNLNGVQTEAQKINGTGIGLDLGLMYVATEGEDEDEYLYKIGGALLDVGAVSFKKNAELHHLNDTTIIIGRSQYENLDQNSPAQDAFNRFLGTNTGANTLQARAFTIGLPMALHLQADARVAPHFYVGASALQRLSFKANDIKRANILAVVPRYENRWLTFAMPISVLEYKRPRVGISGRVGFLTIGTDDVTTFFGKKDIVGTDFYMALKINPMRTGRIGDRKKNGFRSNKDAKCYKF